MQVNIILGILLDFGRQWCCSWKKLEQMKWKQAYSKILVYKHWLWKAKNTETLLGSLHSVSQPRKWFLRIFVPGLLSSEHFPCSSVLEPGLGSQVSLSWVRKVFARTPRLTMYMETLSLHNSYGTSQATLNLWDLLPQNIQVNLDSWKRHGRFYVGRHGLKFQINLGQITKSKHPGFNDIVSQMIIRGLSNCLCVLLMQPAMEWCALKRDRDRHRNWKSKL